MTQPTEPIHESDEPDGRGDAPVVAHHPTLDSLAADHALNRVIKRFGGRHLIFRTQLGKWSVLPRPYALVSNFRGPIWFFYGIGQVWITHKAYREYDGWLARLPRIWRPKLASLLDALESELTEFTHYCNEQGIEGTLVIEPNTIEFHWTFGYPLEKEKLKQENASLLESQFNSLAEAFLTAKNQLSI